METLSRHQCLVYEGPPSRHLQPVAAVAKEMLLRNHRCLYLNSPPMVAGMRSFLAATGVDVVAETDRGRLVLSSEQAHLHEGRFDIDRMMETLEGALAAALADGYAGLWASGDMTWEVGPQKDFGRLLEYEWRLEEFMQAHPQIGGICQYHTDSLPREAVRAGVVSHQSLFVNETLSMINPQYARRQSCDPVDNPALDAVIARLCGT